LANKTLSYDRIVAVGYGSSKPLVSNATEEGHAVNRRIDVIIKPKAESGGTMVLHIDPEIPYGPITTEV
jgi:hypothetical protein